MYTLLVATTNPHKVKEIKSLLDIAGLKLLGLSDFDRYPKVIEDGKTFDENAVKKAETYFDYFGIPVIADDSGLEVDILKGEPGVYSARYAGEHATDADNNALLLKRLRGVPSQKRGAHFVCSVCFADATERRLFRGVREGRILEHPQGKGGFGYDPLFFVPALNKTFAQLSESEKNSISHRAMAFAELKKFLQEKHLKG